MHTTHWVSTLPRAMTSKIACHSCHSKKSEVTSVTCKKQANVTGEHWYSVDYTTRAMSDISFKPFLIPPYEGGKGDVSSAWQTPLQKTKTRRRNRKTPSRFSNFSKFFFNFALTLLQELKMFLQLLSLYTICPKHFVWKEKKPFKPPSKAYARSLVTHRR